MVATGIEQWTQSAAASAGAKCIETTHHPLDLSPLGDGIQSSWPKHFSEPATAFAAWECVVTLILR